MKRLTHRIGLALSGGGFRATLFHLGVIRCLFENDLLKSVKLLSAVSGGSIVAAHLVINWEKYIGSKDDFDVAALEILNFVKVDIRGRVLRRWVLGCSTIIPRFLLRKERQWSLVNLLQREYARLFRVGDPSLEAAPNSVAIPGSGTNRVMPKAARSAAHREAVIKDLRGTRGPRPSVRFNCTSLTTGDPCYFDQTGFGWYRKGVIEEPTAAFSLRVAYAVTASSAFPPLFPPVEISHVNLFCDHKDFNRKQYLTDGGVYDNLGIEALIAECKGGAPGSEEQISLERIIISDAEGNFDSDFGTKYSFPVNRNVRASDLLMKRVSILQLEEFERNFEGAAEQEQASFVRVKIRGPVLDLSDNTVLSPEVQRALINVRTDLDCFSPVEITALIAHGYSKAREALIDKGLIKPDAPKFNWNPLENWETVKGLSASDFQRSRLRKWRLWSSGDPISWVTGMYVLFICLLLATPTLLFAVQSAVQTQKAAEAEAVAATAVAAKAAAQSQVLSGAISQIQNFTAAMSSGCSGGAHGVPPIKWPSLQSHASRTVNALNEARLALAGGRTLDAVQHIDSAEDGLDKFVNGLWMSCPGGSSGQDPVSFSVYRSVGSAVKRNLEELRLSLGG